MMTSNDTPSYTTQHYNTSTHSNENKIYSKKSSRDEIQYGPIHIRVCRKPAPTIATGRRSKHLVLAGDEAIKRDKRRERNREAARKLKERRQCIEDELIQQLKELQGEHANLQEYLHQLRQKKQYLQQEINNYLNDPIDKLLSNNNQHATLFFEQYLDDSDFIDEPLENFLTSDLDISFNSIIDS